MIRILKTVIFLISISFTSSCQENKVDLFIRKNTGGWYHLFIKKDTSVLFDKFAKEIFFDSLRYKITSLDSGDIDHLKFDVYDIHSKKNISDEMRLIGYRPGGKFFVLSFYNPSKNQKGKHFERVVGKKNIIDSLETEKYFELQEIIRKENLDYYTIIDN